MRTLACVFLAATLVALLPRLAAPSEALVVEMREFAFHPAVLRVQAGHPVVLRLVNRGQIAHQFESEALRGLAVTVSDAQMRLETSNLKTLRLQPGASATVWFTPRRPGRFSFACTIEGHREAGMVGILDVY